MNFQRIIGTIGITAILLLSVFYIRKQFNYKPLLVGETKEITGYVIENKISPSGKGAVHEIVYEYTIGEQKYTYSYDSNKSISRLNTGDSLVLEVSISTPTKNKLTGYFRTGK